MNELEEKRLFIISNNTHLLNIKKYIEKYPNGINYIILTISHFRGYISFCEKVEGDPNLIVLTTLFTDKKRKFPFHYFNIILNIIKIKFVGKKYIFFDKILFTNYSSWIQHFIIKQFYSSQIVLISDGTAIFSIVKIRKNDNTIPFKGSSFFINNILRLPPINSIHFYSQVNIDVAENDSLEVFKFKKSSNSKINKRKIYFVGSPLIELGFLKNESNLFFLNRIREKYKDYIIYYFAHRREKDVNIEMYSFFDKIIRDDIPFEDRLRKKGELPGIIISYISSVLINLPQIYSNIQFFYLPLAIDDIPDNSSFRLEYSSLYDKFKKTNLSNLKPLNYFK